RASWSTPPIARARIICPVTPKSKRCARRSEGHTLSLFSLSPLLRGEGWGEGLSPRVEPVERAPHPDRKGDPTSPRKERGEGTSKPSGARRWPFISPSS